MHHLHLEPFVTVASWSADDKIEIWAACQNPFPLRKEISRIFKKPENDILLRAVDKGKRLEGFKFIKDILGKEKAKIVKKPFSP